MDRSYPDCLLVRHVGLDIGRRQFGVDETYEGGVVEICQHSFILV